jgi:hypothetical protein
MMHRMHHPHHPVDAESRAEAAAAEAMSQKDQVPPVTTTTIPPHHHPVQEPVAQVQAVGHPCPVPVYHMVMHVVDESCGHPHGDDHHHQ